MKKKVKRKSENTIEREKGKNKDRGRGNEEGGFSWTSTQRRDAFLGH